MSNEEDIRLKIRKIEALFQRTDFKGERAAAEAALQRMQETLNNTIVKKPDVSEYTFTLDNHWSKTLFIALCRRYKLRPYRYARQRRTTVMVKVEKDFVDNVLWPEYQAINDVLREYINKITLDIISAEIHCDTTDAQEVSSKLLEAS